MNPVFHDILGHERQTEWLRSLVRRGRVAHAYLFSGPEGIGKRTVALQFARFLLCDRRGDDACDVCRHVEEGTSPDLFPLARAEEKQDLSIEQVRDLLKSLAYKAASGRRRIVLVDGAERLSEEAMNALLKTLEEPPERTLFLLVTSAPTAVLPTIVSRCQHIRFAPVPEEKVRDRLAASGLAPEEASLVARLSGGRWGWALQEAEEPGRTRAQRDAILAHLRGGDRNALVESLTRIREPQKSRRETQKMFDLLLVSLRETLRAALQGRTPDPALVPVESVPLLSRGGVDEILRRIETLMEHRRFLDLNANVGLTVENALLRI